MKSRLGILEQDPISSHSSRPIRENLLEFEWQLVSN